MDGWMEFGSEKTLRGHLPRLLKDEIWFCHPPGTGDTTTGACEFP